METAVGSFAIPGATLAQILHDFGSGESDCDGILFGRLQTQVMSSISDDQLGPPTVLQETTARVTGHFCTGRVMSFYDSIGRLNQSKLASILKDRQIRGEDPPIGWYIGRRNSSLWPSMRETAVTASLRAAFELLAFEQPSTLRSLAMTKKKSSVDGHSPMDGRGDDRSGSPVSSEAKTLQSEVYGGQGGGSPSVSRRVQTMQTVDVQSPRSPGRGSFVPALGTDPASGLSTSSYHEKRSDLHSRFGAPPAPAPPPPCFFVLFTESDSANHAVRTHEYRAFQSLQNAVGIGFEALPMKIVNAGLSFRGYYDSFVPVARFPWFQGDFVISTSDRSDSNRSRSPHRGKSVEPMSPRWEVGRHSYVKPTQLELNGKQERSSRRSHDDHVDTRHDGVSGEQALSFIHAKGMRVSEFEKMYQMMLTKLERLATEVCDSTTALHQASR